MRSRLVEKVKSTMLKVIGNDEVEKTVTHIIGLGLSFDHEPEEHNYGSAVLILSDAILSVRRNYNVVVRPIINRIQHHKLHEKSLEQLVHLIDERGPQNLMDLWQYQDKERVVRLRSLSQKFIDLRAKLEVHDDLDLLRRWAHSAVPEDSKAFGIKGVGIATFQYLRILSGVDTVKPDVHLQQAVKDAIGRQCSDFDLIRLIEATARQMEIPARKLDYAIWEYYSDKARATRKCA